MDKNFSKNIAQRLNIYDESVIKKAEEYLRLYQTKASVKTLSDQAKLVLCLDLACQTLGNSLDKETALSLCGLKKSGYQNNLNNLEKVLGIDKALTVSDLCVQLGCTAIKEDAEEIFNKYKKLDSNVKDLEHPQYIAAATYLACRAKKVSVDKPKIAAISRLKPSQWKELLSNFESLGLGKNAGKHLKKGSAEIEENMDIVVDNNETNKQSEHEEIEDYDVWKERILKAAYAALQKEKNNTNMDL